MGENTFLYTLPHQAKLLKAPLAPMVWHFPGNFWGGGGESASRAWAWRPPLCGAHMHARTHTHTHTRARTRTTQSDQGPVTTEARTGTGRNKNLVTPQSKAQSGGQHEAMDVTRHAHTRVHAL